MSAQYPVHFIRQPDEQGSHGRCIQGRRPQALSRASGPALTVPFCTAHAPAAPRATAFLLAPLPTDANVLQQVNHCGRLPRQFYQSGQGPKCSWWLRTHAQVVPLQLLRRLPPGTGSGTGCSSGGLVSDRTRCDCRHSIVSPSLRTDTVRGNGNGSSVGSVVDSCPSAGSSSGLTCMEGMEWTQCRVVLTASAGIVTPSEEAVGTTGKWRSTRYELPSTERCSLQYATAIASGTRSDICHAQDAFAPDTVFCITHSTQLICSRC
jgi:hypothetical protein